MSPPPQDGRVQNASLSTLSQETGISRDYLAWYVTSAVGQIWWHGVWLSPGKCKRLASAPRVGAKTLVLCWDMPALPESVRARDTYVYPRDQTKATNAREIFRLMAFCNVEVSKEITKAFHERHSFKYLLVPDCEKLTYNSISQEITFLSPLPLFLPLALPLN